MSFLFAKGKQVLRLIDLTSGVLVGDSLDNLFMRFEEPSSMVRWDSPLYTLSWQDDISKEKSTNINTNTGEMTPQKTSTTLDDLWIAVTAGVKKGPTAAVAQVR